MPRSCARPGCSDPGVVSYGLAPRLLLAWLSPLAADADPGLPVLCRRHADRTTVPAGWTLDDRREATPRLFRPAPAADRSVGSPDAEHIAPVVELRPRPVVEEPPLPLDLPGSPGARDEGAGAEPAAVEPAAVDPEGALDTSPVASDEAAPDAAADASPDQVSSDDRATDQTNRPGDVGSMLTAHSPLLARAFHGRPRT